MLAKEKILSLGKKQNGIITTKMVSDKGLSRKALSQLENEEKIIRVERGVYVMDFGYVDDYFLLQHRFPQGIFSHETALYLLGYSDRVPLQIQMTFPLGFNTLRAKDAGIQPIISTQDVEAGITSIERSGGTTVNVFEIERTLIDLLKPKYEADKEQLIPALKQYVRSKDKNVTKLMDYARMFNMEKKVLQYLEVLL
ncbi:type IV toxin-antitoxin system AbiEi family antitoxin domain-containing protein [Enterococcus sp. 669A]|uniref:Type IV toxin-antitoxin system AbiEi family antitoxin domain-containing protein n=1 Tax=Candidatus Enterococcus moelleringii TaxID=2815325 RepID=A0ABS3LDI0_9ENTE|nr:type IV toxin-antitoxin system AbiEi family antitoxin domain-containing protein [Enterococcus sp. 669A]MBO1307686.1 type IV toxin-antitoxin system AbiEi family antitoxin domain-containing protein [Enterococcus sp. 669A]